MNIDSQEKLLQAWIQMSMCVRGNRLLSSMSLNEILVCNILLHSQKENRLLTLTDLCDATHLYKSQINRILRDLENKGMIEKIQSETDKRKVYLRLVEENLSLYFREHEQVMQLVSAIEEQMGEAKIQTLTELLTEATEIADKYQMQKERTE